jgi:hypothetical protein
MITKDNERLKQNLMYLIENFDKFSREELKLITNYLFDTL